MLFLTADCLRWCFCLSIYWSCQSTDGALFSGGLDVCTESTGACVYICVCVANTASSRRTRDSVFIPQRTSLSVSGLHCFSPGANTHQTSRRAFYLMSLLAGFIYGDAVLPYIEVVLPRVSCPLQPSGCSGFDKAGSWEASDRAWRVSPSSSEAILNMMVANAKSGTGELPKT